MGGNTMAKVYYGDPKDFPKSDSYWRERQAQSFLAPAYHIKFGDRLIEVRNDRPVISAESRIPKVKRKPTP